MLMLSDACEASEEKITLTSRIKKKHATIFKDMDKSEGSDVESTITKLESDFVDGIERIREALKIQVNEKKSYEMHIHSLEESLRQNTAEKERYLVIMQQMESDVEVLTKKLQAANHENANLKDMNRNLETRHDGHLKSIASQHREKYIAKKTIRKWRGRLKNGISSSQTNNLIEENRKLKQELLEYQECVKNAFLRSANALNSEALGLFQDTATKLLNARETEKFGIFRSSLTRSGSESSVSSSVSEPTFQRDREKAKGLDKQEDRRESPPEKKKTDRQYLHDDKTKTDRDKRVQSDGELAEKWKSKQRKERPRIDFFPDPLRRETQQILRSLDSVRSVPERPKECQSKSHVHICHCNGLAGRDAYCQLCLANENFNFINLPVASKRTTPAARPPFQRKEDKSVAPISGINPRVIYKPSGSTAVIEKHLSS